MNEEQLRLVREASIEWDAQGVLSISTKISLQNAGLDADGIEEAFITMEF